MRIIFVPHKGFQPRNKELGQPIIFPFLAARVQYSAPTKEPLEVKLVSLNRLKKKSRERIRMLVAKAAAKRDVAMGSTSHPHVRALSTARLLPARATTRNSRIKALSISA
jgi:hypothetical protein